MVSAAVFKPPTKCDDAQQYVGVKISLMCLVVGEALQRVANQERPTHLILTLGKARKCLLSTCAIGAAAAADDLEFDNDPSSWCDFVS